MNGMARGTVPADHELAFSRARSKALGEADVAVRGRGADGLPARLRRRVRRETKLIVADRAEPDRPHPRDVAAGLYGDLSTILSALAGAATGEHEGWIGELRGVESHRAGSRAGRARRRAHPAAPDAAVRPNSSRCWIANAIVVIDAGDFGSYARAGHRQLRAGRVAGQRDRSAAWVRVPAMHWPRKLARPDRQVVLLQGDGAFGFSGMEWDTLVRPRRSRSFR